MCEYAHVSVCVNMHMCVCVSSHCVVQAATKQVTFCRYKLLSVENVVDEKLSS